MSRVGWGFDAHPLNDEPPLLLGGVVVSENKGVSATSDGDVLAHAVTDAVLGACVLGDIGEHFPADDPNSVGADSMAILSQAVTMATTSGFWPCLRRFRIRFAPAFDRLFQAASTRMRRT